MTYAAYLGGVVFDTLPGDHLTLLLEQCNRIAPWDRA